MFDRFYRHRDTMVTGNGLRLAIAKEIAVRHGAAILLGSSEALGGLSARVWQSSHLATRVDPPVLGIAK